ncbi:hypothetical protein BDQ17DRAFT_1425028 [Cyathus striatus]|nr:hypothetical protein BDQ17DRAFT_1425028 [Cyathus striatus]
MPVQHGELVSQWGSTGEHGNYKQGGTKMDETLGGQRQLALNSSYSQLSKEQPGTNMKTTSGLMVTTREWWKDGGLEEAEDGKSTRYSGGFMRYAKSKALQCTPDMYQVRRTQQIIHQEEYTQKLTYYYPKSQSQMYCGHPYTNSSAMKMRAERAKVENIKDRMRCGPSNMSHQKVLAESLEESMKTAYASGLLAFHVFCDKKQVEEEDRALVKQWVLATFIAHMVNSYSGKTIRNYVQSVRAWHILHGTKYEVNQL